MFLVITRRTEYRVSVELFDSDEGTAVYQRLLNRFKDNEVAWLARLCNSSSQETTRILNTVCETLVNDEYEPLQIEITPPQSLLEQIRYTAPSGDVATDPDLPFTVTVRDIGQPRAYATGYSDPEPGEALRSAFLEASPEFNEPIIEWTDKQRLCVLDVDYHTLPLRSRPDHKKLAAVLARIRPQPFCWHPSHRGGAKLYYVEKPGNTAEELAAVAGLSWIASDARATFDLIKASRHPCYPRERDSAPAPLSDPEEVHYIHGGADLVLLRRLLASDMDQEETDAFLLEQGWSIGQTLPHSQCPIDAGSSSDETKLSVYIGDRGVFCHRCQSRGLGVNGSGFISYASLLSGVDSRVALMVRSFCHAEHARVILGNLFPNVGVQVLDTVYRAMLKMLHTPDDPRIGMCFSAGKGFIRTRGIWVSADGLTTVGQGLKEFVKSLPAVLVPTDKGFSINVARYTAFLNSGDLASEGYPAVLFIRGCRIHSIHNDSKEITRTIVRPEFADVVPKYIPRAKRMSKSEAWELLDTEFPGISPTYVKLLIIAKGAAEGRLAQCPFLLVTGPAGSGKSTTPHIVAGICGDKADEPVWHPHPERFRAALMDSARESSFVVINEVFKSADMNRLSHVQALNPMLSLTPDSRSHVLYVGSVPFGRLPVFILTDVNVPRDVETDIQIARRFTYLRLSTRCYWDDTFVNRGIRAHEYRLISADHAASADSILSEVIDEFFSEPSSLRDMAIQLGITPLESASDDTARKQSLMQKFYEAVLAAPVLVGSDASRYAPGRGWKRVDRVSGVLLNELWLELCDGSAPENWVLSRQCDAEDWAKVLGLHFPIVCDIRSYQQSIIYVRFRSADSGTNPQWINGYDMDSV